jgi:hypothetical protein
MTGRLRRIEDAAASDLVVPFQDDFYGLGVDAMFLFQDAGGKSVLVVGIEDGDGGLQDDGAGVEIFVDEMDGAAGEFYAVVEGLFLGFEAGEGWEERRMDVENALGKGGYEKWRKKAHVASEADKIDFVFVEDGGELAVVGFALEARRGWRGRNVRAAARSRPGRRALLLMTTEISRWGCARRRHYRRGLRSWSRDRLENADAMGHNRKR